MDPAPRPRHRGRLVLVLFGIAVGIAAAWLLVRAPSGPDVPLVTPQAAGPEQPIAVYLARADAARGEAYFSRCAACHTAAQGGPNSIGPNLYGVAGGPVAARPDFSYSPALRGLGGNWDRERLSRFLHEPRAFAPGTRMTFAGVMDPQDRADVILYLNRQGGRLAEPAR